MLVTVVLATLLTRPAVVTAQGTTGALPDPITTRELMRYAERLDLSEPQRAAVTTIHDDYRRDFRILRDGEIAEFLGSMHGMQGGGMPERERVEKFLEDMERLLLRIESLDDRMFERMLPILSEAQAAELPRVRLDRARDRYEIQSEMTMMGRSIVDLSDIFRSVDVPEEAFPAVDSVIAGYERRLTTRMRDLSRSARRMMLDMMDAISAEGFSDLTEEEMNDPEKMAELMEAMQAAFAEMTQRSNAIVGELHDLNHRTFRSVVAVLPEPAARAFRHAYYEGTYNELARLVALSRQDPAGVVLEHAQLNAAEREQVTAIRGRFRTRMDRLLTDGGRLLDTQREAYSPFDFDSDVQRERRDALDEIRQSAATVFEETKSELATLIGVERLSNAIAAAERAGGSADGNAAGATVAAEPREEEFLWSGDQFLPSRIGRSQVRAWARRLELDEGRRDVLFELHAGYVDRYDGSVEIARLHAANGGLWRRDADGTNVTPPTDEMIDEVYALRREALTAIAGMEAELFDDIRLAVVDVDQTPLVDRIQRARQRAIYLVKTGPTNYFGSDEAREGTIDIITIIDDTELSPASASSVAPTIASYDEDAIAHFRARFDAQMDLQRATDRWTARAQHFRQNGGANGVQQYADIIGPATVRLTGADRAVVELNRRTLDAAISALSHEEARAVTRAYDRLAFPSVYGDAMSADGRLDAALALPDLSPSQRVSIDELAADFRPEYETLSRRLTEIITERGQLDPSRMDREYWRTYQQYQEKLERARFERTEVNDRAVHRLRAILTAEQIRRIGGLTDSDAEDA
jgi:hypothetical protein